MDVVLMKRTGIYFKLKPGAKEGYVKAHDEIWPEMREVLNMSGMKNYSIWNVDDKLFAYYEIEDESYMQNYLSQNEIYNKWRKVMEDFIYIDQETNVKEWSMNMVFYNKGN